MPDKQEAQSAVITGIELDNWTVHVNIHSIHSSAERNIFSSAERNIFSLAERNILQLQSDTRWPVCCCVHNRTNNKQGTNYC